MTIIIDQYTAPSKYSVDSVVIDQPLSLIHI